MEILNRKAKHNYKLLEKFEAGIVLNGAEVKAVKEGRVDISGSYAKIIGDEAYLVNTNIAVPGKKEYDPTRTRKLLLHKDEIISLKSEVQGKALTLVPTRLYTKGRLVKAEIALAKAKKKYEKRQSLKEAEVKRQIERELKELNY